MTTFDFDTLVGGGSSIYAVDIAEDQFRTIVLDPSKRFHREAPDPAAAYQELMPAIRFVAGTYWNEVARINRKSVGQRLRELEAALARSAELLVGLNEGLQFDLDVEVINILAMTKALGRQGILPRDTRRELETGLHVIEAMHATVEQALVVVTMSSSRKGRRQSDWKAELFDLMASVAGHLGIEVTTAGSREANPYSTPFTELVFEIERFLPEGMHSESLAACARRIDRARGKGGPKRK
ncbi:hypothetical protein [Microvirga sp. 2TAF3]|uniref:hypothetical protein n=1 Tax=Microvirga sp. 2TAF3 TaxID=3233014 RepID=UPI003F9492A4